MANATVIGNRIKSLFSNQHWQNNATLTNDVTSLFMPRRSNVIDKKSTGTEVGWYDHLVEPAPAEIARTLAQGQYDLLFTGKWFEGKPPTEEGEQSDSAKKSYEEAGNRMRETIGSSNFQLEVQEFLGDRSSSHTAVFLVDEDEDEVFYCYNLVPGSYAIAENYKKRADTLARKIPLTARQIEQKFSKSTDRIPKKVQEAIANGKPETEFEVMQLIEPRSKNDVVAGSDNPKKMPFASLYLFETSMIREGGYHEQPFFVSRFDRWGDSPYGTGPAHIELPRARSLQKMRAAHIALGDRITNPGLFISTEQDEEVKPFGTTAISKEDAALGLPREWNTTARYDVTVDLIEREIKQMEDVFFIPLFKLLMNDTDREKTAFEVQKMLEEQVGRAAPTFSRLDKEFVVPFLSRVFNIMLRAGKFADIEEDMLAIDPKTKKVGVNEPAIEFTSKLAQAMNAVRSNTVISFLQSLGFLFEMKPDVLQNGDWDKTYRRMWVESGNPYSELRDPKKVQAERDQIEEAQRAQAGIEAAATAAKAGKDIR
jgi:hypothetical protein